MKLLKSHPLTVLILAVGLVAVFAVIYVISINTKTNTNGIPSDEGITDGSMTGEGIARVDGVDSWDQLTDAQKLDLNPFGCSKTQTISEVTGRCFDNPSACLFEESSFFGLPRVDIDSISKAQEALEAEHDPEFSYDSDGKKITRMDSELKRAISSLGLTDRGTAVLEDIDELIWFNKHEHPEPDCAGDLPALGMHGGNADFDWIAVFYPDPSKETLGHEFLHAVFARLPEQEQNDLGFQLEEFYKVNKETLDRETLIHAYDYITGELSIEDCGTYCEGDSYRDTVWTELYAILGTHVYDLPPDLEEYYAQYLQDRQAIFADTLYFGQDIVHP